MVHTYEDIVVLVLKDIGRVDRHVIEEGRDRVRHLDIYITKLP